MPLKVVRKPLGIPLIELESTESTNKYAMGLIHEGMATHGLAIISHEQTAGRGQRGKSWISTRDKDLTLSIIIDPQPLTINQQFRLSVCTAVSVYDVVSRYLTANVFLKWPNDIYIADSKAGGILIENNLQGSEWKWAVIGIGINVNQEVFPKDLPNPTSLLLSSEKTFDIKQLAKDICDSLTENFYKLPTNFSELLNRYREHLYKKGEEVKFKKQNRVFTARILDVTESGELLIHHGVEELVKFGEVELVVEKRL